MAAGYIPCLERYINSLDTHNLEWRLPNSNNDKSSQPKGYLFSDRLLKEHELERPSDHCHGTIPSKVNKEEGFTLPFEIRYSSEHGRYLAATRHIMAGEILFKEPPLVVSPKAGVGPTCLSCLRSLPDENWPTCSICSAPLCQPYCPCEGHTKRECQSLTKLNLNKSEGNGIMRVRVLNTLLTPLRTWFEIQNSQSSLDVVEALQSNVGNWLKSPIGIFIEMNVVQVLCNKLDLGIKRELILHMCGVFDTNAFEVTLGNNRLGRALLPLCGLMNHSCVPNTQHWFKDGMCVVRAAVAIEKGEPITNTYTQTLWGTRARSRHLSLTKHFKCACRRCLDPSELGSHFSSILCQACRANGHEGLVVPSLDHKAAWICNSCKAPLSAASADMIVRASAAMFSQLNRKDISSLLEAEKRLSYLLGRQHYIMTELHYAVISHIMDLPLKNASTEMLMLILQLTDRLQQLATCIEPGMTRFRGLMLFDKLRAAVELLRRKHNEDNLSCFNDGHDLQQTDANSEEVTTIIGSLQRSSRTEKESGTDGERFCSRLNSPEELMRQAAECEEILPLDPVYPEFLQTTRHLRLLLGEQDPSN